MRERNLLAIDLELNQPSGVIIQIGYCVGDPVTGDVLLNGSFYINTDEKITEYITNLTGITQEDLESKGIDLIEAYYSLQEIQETYNCWMNPLVWGMGDSEAIKKQLKDHLDFETEGFIFGRRSFDAKARFQANRLAEGKHIAGGLKTAMGKFGLKFEGRPHDAKWDALNTFRIFYYFLQKEREHIL